MIRKILFLICCIMVTISVHAQNANPGQQLANHIAQKMKDTLNLTVQQRNDVYAINMQLNYQKNAARQQYAGSSTLGYHLQLIEHTRDSLYNRVLPTPKYLLYRQKKSNLVNNN